MVKLQPHHYNVTTSHTDVVAAVRTLWADVASQYCKLPETPNKQCSLLQKEEAAAWAALADDLPSSTESTYKIYTLTKGIHRPATVMTQSHNEHNAQPILHLTAHWLILLSNAYAWWYATRSLWMQYITMTKQRCRAANNRYRSDTVKFLNNSPDRCIG
jgi:hypothetical protein